MRRYPLILVISSTLALAACGTQAPQGQAPAADSPVVRQLVPTATPPAKLAEAERIPPALSQMMTLQRSVSQKQSAQSIKAVSSLDVDNPHGLLVVRLEVLGPTSVDLLSGEALNDEYTYSIVGANSTQDRVYVYGNAKYLSEKLRTTLEAVGGKTQVKSVVTANLMDLIIQTNAGDLYLVGEKTPMTRDQIANSLEVYETIMQAYEDHPEAADTNAEVWKALAGNTGAKPGSLSLNDVSKTALAEYTLPDGNLNLTKALAVVNHKLSASSLNLAPMALRAMGGNSTAYDGQYTYPGTLPGGGFAQYSLYWNQLDANGQSLNYYTYSWVGGPANTPYYQMLIGCSASSAQALIHDMFRKGNSVSGKIWTPGRDAATGITNDALYSVSNVYPNGAAKYFPDSFPTYAILNQENADGANFSTSAMNAGHHNGQVVNSVWDIAWGLNQMLNKVWPERYPLSSNHVWSEWKTAGKGSGGTMREILATQLPAGRTVIVSYPTGGTTGHTSIAKFADLVSYQSWMFWTGYDAWVNTIDHPNENRLLTGTYVAASGVYSVYY
ncbi:hypothetical protein [Deinococcus sp. PESE-13]